MNYIIRRMTTGTQDKFRKELIKRDQFCILSGLCHEVCEAAHLVNKECIKPSCKSIMFNPHNGILLNSNLHKEFDMNFWTIDMNEGSWDIIKKDIDFEKTKNYKCDIKLHPIGQKKLDTNMKLASKAREKGMEKQMILSSRKAARLKEVNAKYDKLHNRMQILYRILSKMYQNSEILIEDTADNVALKKQERKAIRGSHSAMKSAMSVISGDPDKRAMFDMAMERVADDVADKVGEMERFMEMSSGFMDSIDLQNGVFEEEGIKMLEEYEKRSNILLMGDGTNTENLDLNIEVARPESRQEDESSNDYKNLFE